MAVLRHPMFPQKKNKKSAAKDPKPMNVTKKVLRNRNDTSKCGICLVKYCHYNSMLEWIQCLQCKKWICGMCNEGSKDPYFICSRCDDESEIDEDPFGDNSDDDATFDPSQPYNKRKF